MEDQKNFSIFQNVGCGGELSDHELLGPLSVACGNIGTNKTKNQLFVMKGFAEGIDSVFELIWLLAEQNDASSAGNCFEEFQFTN